MDICSYEGEAVWYAPDYLDNREKPEDERFAVLMVPASQAELRRLDEKHGKVKITRGGNVNTLQRYHKSRAATLTRCIREVANLTRKRLHDGEPKRTPVTTSRELVEIAPEDLLEELANVLKENSLLEEGMLGKSDSQSDSFI